MTKEFKSRIKSALNQLPYIRKIFKELEEYRQNSYVPPGHFYSPVISLSEIRKRENQIFGSTPRQLPGIELNEIFQLELLEAIKPYGKELTFMADPNNEHRYYYENRYFTYADVIFLNGIIRHFRPERIIEIGSGFSSAAMLDLNDIFFEKKIELIFIEPYPENRLAKLVRATDRYELIDSFLQDVDLNIFKNLRKNDILFIDSSHVVKTGGEVNYLLFNILPELVSGVIIHFHDIFYPFEYPRKWIEEKRSWNENYFIRAFLMHNSEYEIVAFNSFLQKFYPDWFKLNMPLCLKDDGGSLWLRKK